MSSPSHIDVRVLRQDAPDRRSYWERHRLPYELDMNVISVLQRIAAQAKNREGSATAPVAWECNCLEEVCGACTMVVNGRVRQACTALVDRLLDEQPGEIELRPMSKFPVVRDLVVNRRRMFRALQKVQAWIPVDGYYDKGAGPRMSQDEQGVAYPLSECMTCGCCLEACPQYTQIKTPAASSAAAHGDHHGHAPAGHTASPADTTQAENVAFDQAFVGAHAISQAMLFNTHPTGRMSAAGRLDALMAPGGVQVCGNAQNCVAVCPKNIPLTTSIARAGRAVTVYAIRKWFDK